MNVYRVVLGMTMAADALVDANGITEEQAAEAALAEAFHKWHAMQWRPVLDSDGEPAIQALFLEEISREQAEAIADNPPPITIEDVPGLGAADDDTESTEEELLELLGEFGGALQDLLDVIDGRVGDEQTKTSLIEQARALLSPEESQ